MLGKEAKYLFIVSFSHLQCSFSQILLSFAGTSDLPTWPALILCPKCIQEKGKPQHPGNLNHSLPTQFDHNIGNLDVLLRCVFCCDFENDILLMTWDWFLGNGFKELAHPMIILVWVGVSDIGDLLQWHSILELGWRIEACI